MANRRRPPEAFLHPWRSRLFQVLAGLFLFVAVGGFFITNFFEFTVFYQFLVLLHTLLGLLLIAPFCYYMVRHGWLQWRIGLPRPKRTGLLVSVSMSTALASGLALVVYSARSELQWLVYAHMWSSVVGVLALAIHLVQGWILVPGQRAFKRRVAGPRVLTAALAPVAAVLALAATYTHAPYYQAVPPEYAYVGSEADGPYFPSEARTATDQLITLAAVANSQSCGTRGCHTAILEQWEQSLHRLSFHEPIYRANELDFISERDVSQARWCASCHEPVVLLSGNLDATSPLDPATLTGHPDDAQFNEGISCVACHGITRNDSRQGVGSYIFGTPDYYIYTARREPVFREINKLLIRVKPQPHRTSFLQPVLTGTDACMSCHKVFMDANVNGYRWIELQNQFDSWRMGPWSHENFLTFRTQPLMRCVDCHMANETVAFDVASNDGMVRNHAFAGANPLVPLLFGNAAQERRVLENKRDRLRVAIAEVQAADAPDFVFHTKPYLETPLQHSAVHVAAGQTLNVAVTVTNTGIGHRFPTGTNDAKDVWLEFVAKDAAGRTVFHSGFMGPDGTIDPEAHFFRVVPLDQDGAWIQTRRMWTVRTLAYKRTIPPGGADLTVYRFTLPDDAAGPLTLTARVRYRKLSKPFMDHVAAVEPRVRDQPVITMGTDTLTVGVGEPGGTVRPAPVLGPLLVDYGIGLFREGNMEFARRAFLAALERDPDDPRLYTNVGMTYFRESKPALAREWFARSRAVNTSDARVLWFEALIREADGDYPGALARLDLLLGRYPKSELALFETAKLHAWLGDTARARDAYAKVLDLNPNRAGAYRGLAQTYRQAGRDAEAEALHTAFLRLRKDTNTGPWLNRFYAAEPWIATTTRPGYIHDRGRRDDGTSGAATGD